MNRSVNNLIAGWLRRKANRADKGLSRLNAMIRDYADGVVVIDAERIVRFVNPAAEAMLGQSFDDLVGQPFSYPLEIGVAIRLNIVRSGQPRIVSDLRVVETDIDGERGYLASIRDVSAQVKAEEGERLRGKELDAVGRIAAILVLNRDLKLKCTEVLEVLTDTVQADFATIRVRDDAGTGLRLVAQGGLSSVRRQSVLSTQHSVSAEALRLEQPVVANDYPAHPLSDPREIDLGIKSIVVLPIRFQSKVMGVVNVVSQRSGHFTPERVDVLTAVVDVVGASLENSNLYQQVNEELVQRIKAEEALKETETRFRDLVEGSSDILWETDQAGVYTYCSSNVENILGYAPSDMVGRTVFSFMPPDEGTRMKELVDAKAAAGEPFALVEHQVVNKDWSIGWMECSGKPMFDDAGSVIGYRGVDRDISARKTEEEERRALEIRALAQSRLATLGEVATGVAHEINQPLTYISIMVQSFQEDLQLGDLDTESALLRLNESIRQVDRITEIVTHLRTFGRQDETTSMPVDLRQVLDNTLLLIGDRTRNMNIAVVQVHEEGVPIIMGNPSQLEQVFTNLFQNSIHALNQKKNEVGAEIKISVALAEDGRSVRIDFTDNGSGIPPDNREKIFDPFFSTKEVGSGTGLGLSIVYGIIQDHNGSITCESELNEGTTITILLPVGSDIGSGSASGSTGSEIDTP
ncbi:MAG: PAS domain S-box protein [Chloroflexi bacterium]|nr:PAS domain S-box protein [Chloroflexota bacterium]MDA1272388.1 PAS domain S-box protein [Chloroflexota bacterium]PKB58216.1 MAG: hypothetical protein BZY83_08220 [SAR202 cluster bacterium Casp-Chloro-G2]